MVIEALPDLALAAAALLLLLVAAGLWVLQKLLGDFLGRVPVIGSWIQRNVDAGLNDARNAVLHAAGSAWDAAKHLFDWVGNTVTRTIQAITHFTLETELTIENVVFSQLPALERRVEGVALNWVLSATAAITSAYRATVRVVANEVTQLRSDALAWYHDAISHADQLYNTLQADLTRDITNAERAAAGALASTAAALSSAVQSAETTARSDLDALALSAQGAVSQLATDIIRETDAAEATAAAALAGVKAGIYTDLETWGDAAVTRAWPDAAGDIASLRKTIGADFPWLNDALGGLAGLGTAGLLGALYRSLAGTQAITRLADECIVPNCRNLSGLGNDLSNLLSDASTAAMLAWLIFGVTDPAGWAQETYDVAGPVASGLAHAGATLFGS